MNQVTIVCNSPNETAELGKYLASHLKAPLAIALCGPLGAGKTQLAKALISSLGISETAVASPTFTICHEHQGPDFPLYHIDLYRISDEDELLELGMEQWTDGEGVAIIEWADRFEDVMDSCGLIIQILIGEGNAREIRLFGKDPHGIIPLVRHRLEHSGSLKIDLC